MCGFGLNFSYEKTFNFSGTKLPEKIDTDVFEINFKENQGYQNDCVEYIENAIVDIQEQLPEGVVVVLYAQDCDPGNNDFYLLFDDNNYFCIDVNNIVVWYNTPESEKDEHLQKATAEVLKEMKENLKNKIQLINKTLKGE